MPLLRTTYDDIIKSCSNIRNTATPTKISDTYVATRKHIKSHCRCFVQTKHTLRIHPYLFRKYILREMKRIKK